MAHEYLLWTATVPIAGFLAFYMGRYIYRSHGHTAHAYVYGDGHRSILHCRDHSISGLPTTGCGWHLSYTCRYVA